MMHVLSTLLIYSNLLFQKGISNISLACKFTSLLEVSVHQDLSPVWVGSQKYPLILLFLQGLFTVQKMIGACVFIILQNLSAYPIYDLF